MPRSFTARIRKEDDMFIAECLEIGTISQGESVENAISNLKEATELYLEEFPITKNKQSLILKFQA